MKLNHYNEVIQTEPGTRPTTGLEGTVAAVTASRLRHRSNIVARTRREDMEPRERFRQEASGS